MELKECIGNFLRCEDSVITKCTIYKHRHHQHILILGQILRIVELIGTSYGIAANCSEHIYILLFLKFQPESLCLELVVLFLVEAIAHRDSARCSGDKYVGGAGHGFHLLLG